MKKLLMATLSAVSMTAVAQDVIVCKNGDEISSKILKISSTEVEYKKWTNLEGPTYTMGKAEVFMIKYQNGDKDVFRDVPEAETTTEKTAENSNTPVLATPAANNADLIAEYNNETHEYYSKKPKKSEAWSAIGTLGITSSSILSTNDIEISLRQAKESESLDWWDAEIGKQEDCICYNIHRIKYVIEITNKTSQIIYIDKASCTRISSQGETMAYYNYNKVSTAAGSNKGLSVNAGAIADAIGVGGVVGTLANGVNVGGGKNNTTVIEHQDSRLIMIPPKATVLLSKDDYMKIKGHSLEYDEGIITGVSEVLNINNFDLHHNEYLKFTEENSPSTLNYTITYSLSANLDKCHFLNFGVYLKDAMGVNKRIRLKHIDKYFKSRSPKTIVVCDWDIENENQ